MSERYPLKVGKFSSHSRITELLGDGNGCILLDIGCAQGHLMSKAIEQGWQAVGIEFNLKDADVATSCGLDVLHGSAEEELEKLNVKFDAVVIADVLEHLVDPNETLRLAISKLAPDGKIIISLPNIAHLTVRLSLLFGKFNYSDKGILDRTHLHFYTRRTLLELLTRNGLENYLLTVTPAPIEEVFPIVDRFRLMKWISFINFKAAQIWKSGLAYQYIVVAVPKGIEAS